MPSSALRERFSWIRRAGVDSNYGSSVDFAAPGGDCGQGYPSSACVGQYLIANAGISAAGNATYPLYAGTSMATPHVSAVSAYARSIHPESAPGQTRSRLKQRTRTVGSRQSSGAGMVDADVHGELRGATCRVRPVMTFLEPPGVVLQCSVQSR